MCEVDDYVGTMQAFIGLRTVVVERSVIGQLVDMGKGILPRTIQIPGFRELTRLETALFAAGVGYVSLQAYSYGGFGLVGRAVAKLVPGFKTIKYWAGFSPEVVLASENPVMTRSAVFESVRAGSVESPLLRPKFQAVVGCMDAGEFKAHGNAVRMGSWLVMPSHVFAAVQRVQVKGSQSILDITDKESEMIETDLLAFKMTDKELSVIGIKDAVVERDIPLQGSYVQIVGAAGRGTSGSLRHDRLFGRVVYEGTTVGGYSGAAYCSNHLVGIHTNGGAVNGGFSAGYIQTILQALDKERFEDSEDWLRNSFKKGTKVLIDPKWSDVDEVRVRVGGKYAIVSRDSMSKAFGSGWHDRMGGFNELSKEPENHYDPEMGESTSSNPGASSVLDQSPGLERLTALELMDEFQKLSGTQRKKFVGLFRNSNQTTFIPETLSKSPVNKS